MSYKDRDRLREDAKEIFFAGLEAVKPDTAILNHISIEEDRLITPAGSFNLKDIDKIYVVGGGKAASPMARGLESVLGSRITKGLLITKYSHREETDYIEITEAGHPIPDESGFNGANRILNILKETDERDLVICLISGGGSALLTAPVEGVSLKDKQRLTSTLLECGADICEINTLRKHISRIKGGRLAKRAFPSTVLSLIISDVVGDDLSTIASGPTYPDSSTFEDCFNVIDRYGIRDRIPASIIKYLERGISSAGLETPKEGDPAFKRTHNIIIANNRLALESARRKAESLGYNTIILSSTIEGETRDVARMHTAILRESYLYGDPVKRPACILSGGETTVTIRGDGKGGRNQEFALASAPEIDGLDDVMILSAGTDGTDGPTDATGAFVDGKTVKRAKELDIDPEDYLMRNDSYNFFKQLGDLFITGPTKTNVMDLRIMLIG